MKYMNRSTVPFGGERTLLSNVYLLSSSPIISVSLFSFNPRRSQFTSKFYFLLQTTEFKTRFCVNLLMQHITVLVSAAFSEIARLH